MKGEKNFYFSSAISTFVELHSKIEVTAEEVRENVGRNEMKNDWTCILIEAKVNSSSLGKKRSNTPIYHVLLAGHTNLLSAFECKMKYPCMFVLVFDFFCCSLRFGN